MANKKSIKLEDEPRKGTHASKFGSYELAIRPFIAVADPGDKIKLEIYISGYGYIGPAKLVFYPSPEIFDQENSTIRYKFKMDGNLLTFEGESQSISPDGMTIFFGDKGLMGERWKERTIFIDTTVDASPPHLLTETKQINAPIDISLVTTKDARPGTYSLNFIFTYYNGSEWKTSNQTFTFQIRNLYQRNETLIAIIASMAAVMAILSGLTPIINFSRALIRLIF